MKIKIYVDIGFVGAKREKVVEIDDEELADLEGADRDEYIEDFAREEMFNLIEWGWEPIDG